MHENDKPQIFDFLDVFLYLNSYFEWRKKVSSRFSIARWAREMDDFNKVTLRFAIQQQRPISDLLTQKLKEHLNLNPTEQEYFTHLVSYSQSKTPSEKVAFGNILLKLQKNNFKQTDIRPSITALHVFAPLVLTLLTFDDVKKDPSTLAELLSVPLSEIEFILSQLMEQKVISQKPDRTYHFDNKTFRTPDGAELKTFYEYWIDRSKAALALPPTTRKYRCLKFALSPEEYQQALEKINDYALSLLTHFQSNNLAGRRLYMFESCIFPVSKELQSLEATEARQNPDISP